MTSETADRSEPEVLFELVQRRYGERLTVEQSDELRKEIENIVKTCETIRSVALKDYEEPFLIIVSPRRRK